MFIKKKKAVSKIAVFVGLFLLSSVGITSCNNEGNSTSCGCVVETDEDYFWLYFSELVDPHSNGLDWENPLYGQVSLPSSDDIYDLNCEETYQLTSQFNYFKFCNFVRVDEAEEKLLNQVEGAIDILGAYFMHDTEYKDGDPLSIAHFYVCQDGTVVIKDCLDWLYNWTDSGLISYEEFYEEVLGIIGIE